MFGCSVDWVKSSHSLLLQLYEWTCVTACQHLRLLSVSSFRWTDTPTSTNKLLLSFFVVFKT